VLNSHIHHTPGSYPARIGEGICFFSFFEAESCYVALADLELVSLLPQLLSVCHQAWFQRRDFCSCER
jgi:hypothetical protein